MKNVRCPICDTDMRLAQHKRGEVWSIDLDMLILRLAGIGITARVIGRMIGAGNWAVHSRLNDLRRGRHRRPRAAE